LASKEDRAHDYLRDVSLAMNSGYTLDCVAHVCALARLLYDAGRAPWIGRLRETIEREDHVFHAPLIPTRFKGNAARTWTTHYVCCSENEVYDPIAGRPLRVDEYARIIFGRALPVVEHFSPQVTADLLERGELRLAFRPGFRESRPSP
jgi:hypothetical protein